MFYIGSTSIAKIERGYRGSVTSREFKNLWKRELKENPNLFKTMIISKFFSRKMAMYRESILQRKLNVHKSPMYINKSIASPSGIGTINTSGRNHPLYGKKRSYKINTNWLGKKHTNETKLKISKSNKGRKDSISVRNQKSESKKGELNPKYGVKTPHLSEYMLNDNPSKIRCSCIICKMVTNYSSIIRYHKHS